MRKAGLLFVALALCATVGAQEIVSNFQKKYEKDIEFTLVNVSARMFEMIGIMIDAPDDHILKNLTGLRMINTRERKQELFKDALSVLQSSGHDELATVQSKDESVRMFTKDKNGVIASAIVLMCTADDFTMIGLTGKIDLKQFASLAKELNIDQLNKIPQITE